jgi:hypothetical protein
LIVGVVTFITKVGACACAGPGASNIAKVPAAAVAIPHLTKPISTSLSGAFYFFLESAVDRHQSPRDSFYRLSDAAAYDRTCTTV